MLDAADGFCVAVQVDQGSAQAEVKLRIEWIHLNGTLEVVNSSSVLIGVGFRQPLVVVVFRVGLRGIVHGDENKGILGNWVVFGFLLV